MREDTTSLKIPKELSETVNRRKDNKKKTTDKQRSTNHYVPYTKHKMLPFKKYLMIGSSLTHVSIYILEED
jgi:hypothetical protein